MSYKYAFKYKTQLFGELPMNAMFRDKDQDGLFLKVAPGGALIMLPLNDVHPVPAGQYSPWNEDSPVYPVEEVRSIE